MGIRENEIKFPLKAFKKGFPGKPVGEFALFFICFNLAIIKKGFIASPLAEADDMVDLILADTAAKKTFPEFPEAADLSLSRSSQSPDSCPGFNLIF